MDSAEQAVASPAVAKRKPKSALIIVENQAYLRDTRVKAEAMTLRDAGWRVHVICPAIIPDGRRRGEAGIYATEDIGGVLVHSYQIRFASRGFYRYLKEYLLSMFHITRLSWRVYRAYRFSVIHLCNPPDILFAIGFPYKVIGIKVVFDQHDLFPEMILSRYHGLLKKTLYLLARALEFLTFKSADAVISTNRSYRNLALRRGHVDESKVFVVRNGPVLGEISPDSPEPILKRGFLHMACYAGIMGPEDGVVELIDAIHFIVQSLGRRDIRFCLLGDGAAREKTVGRVRKWGLEPFVEMPGMILDRGHFRRYLSTADVLLAPELSNPLNDKSTFIKIAEYMAMGKPIVAYDLRETRYTAEDAAIYVPSGDFEAYGTAIVRLLDNPARRARMGDIGIDRVKKQFCWEHQRAGLLAAYDQVLSGQPKNG